MRAMASATFTYFFTTDTTRATDRSVPQEWTRPPVSSSQPATIVWTHAR
jgi:hypothetical protein